MSHQTDEDPGRNGRGPGKPSGPETKKTEKTEEVGRWASTGKQLSRVWLGGG